MTDIRVVGASKDFDLRGLNTWVRQKERLMGPIVGMGAGEAQSGEVETAGSFDLDKKRLQKNFANVQLKVGDKVVLAGDEVLVCEGKAYISGVLTPVFLFRAEL